MARYEISWQEWDESGRVLLHGYRDFDYASLAAQGREDVLARYEYCMEQFQKLSKAEREAGLIFGGRYDFSIAEVG